MKKQLFLLVVECKSAPQRMHMGHLLFTRESVFFAPLKHIVSSPKAVKNLKIYVTDFVSGIDLAVHHIE